MASLSRDILSLRRVTRRFPGFLLDEVTFSLKPGSIMGLIGQNGAGKTTTIKLILNLLHLHGGSISVFGLDSRDNEIEIKRNLGYVGEHVLLPPRGTALWLGRFLSICFPTWDEALYRQYLTRFSVPLNKPSQALSRGTRVKLALAAALAPRPRLLILDEPTSGLDPLVRHEVVAAIREVVQDGRRGVLFSSHIVSDLETAADWITVLDGGRIVTTDAKDDLLGRWRRLSFRVREAAGFHALAACGALMERRRQGDLFEVVTGSFTPDLLTEVERIAAGPVAVEPLKLEEVFRYLVCGDRTERGGEKGLES